ncbi:MAG: zinc-binding dehydrogenase, partial [bacterium]
TLITTAGTVMYGIERIGGIRPGETVVVTGPGPIGLMGVQVAKALGAGRVILTGTRESRLEVGREIGADEIIDIRQDDPVQKINELTHGVGADVVVECSGNPRAPAQAIDLIRKGGRIALVGIYQEPVTLNLNKVVQWNLSLAGGKAEGMWNLERAVPLMTDGRIKAEPLITHTFPLDKINEAMQVFVKRIGGAIKVVIRP